MSDLVERLQKREHHFRHAVEGEYDADLIMKARFALDDYAARITALEASLAEAEGRMKEVLKPFVDCCEYISDVEDDEEWAKFRLLIKDYRAAKQLYTALETGEWKKDSPPPPTVV